MLISDWSSDVCSSDLQMVVLSGFAPFGAPAPRHAEVEDHMIVAIGRDDAIFGAARQRRHRRAGQPLREIGGKGPAQVGAEGGRKGGGWGRSVSGRVDVGGRRINKKKRQKKNRMYKQSNKTKTS